MHLIEHLIDGQLVASPRRSPVYQPASGQIQAELCLADQAQVDQAVAAAKAAQPAWGAVTPLQRSRVMFRFKALLEAHAEEMARLINREHGKVLSDARGEVTRGLEVVEFACGIPHLLKGEHSMNVGR
ncbi:MAG: aldehyde dehydrogenase family protein, partial [Xanthomonadales bacterium]|nr:aldehyde dehydrogenase family protein [Xanthomonadales bacterium]